MSWIKDGLTVLLVSVMTIVVVDGSALFFKTKLQTIFPGYGIPVDTVSRGYPINHFQHDDTLGFDITPNYKTSTFTKPREYGRYDVWGNSYGCFDDEWPKNSLEGGVYLAGDSFTWGYASYEKKFGTLLEDLINRKVYACGVTHTGQRHQFLKFKRLFENGLRPKEVIVNIVSNDLDNDFFFPHTTIINGFMVENIETCYSFGDKSFRYKRISDDQLEAMVSERSRDNFLRSLLRVYSLTANVIATMTRKFRSSISEDTKNACSRSVYAGLYKIQDEYSSGSFTASNREYIKSWVDHSKENGYSLIFSFIPSKETIRQQTYPFIQKYIKSIGGEVAEFSEYCKSECPNRFDLYYEIDGHFNETGNAVYAMYLSSLIGQ